MSMEMVITLIAVLIGIAVGGAAILGRLEADYPDRTFPDL
jgi:hypothetical protein